MGLLQVMAKSMTWYYDLNNHFINSNPLLDAMEING